VGAAQSYILCGGAFEVRSLDAPAGAEAKIKRAAANS